MKTQFAMSAILFAAIKTEGADNGGGAAVMDKPAEAVTPAAEKAAKEAAEAAEEAAKLAKASQFKFGGVALSPVAFEGLESAWKSAHGRIKSAVSKRAEIIGQMDIESTDRKKSAVKLGVNVTLDVVITSGTKTVAKVAKELLDAKLISAGDASVMVAYVTVWEAVVAASKAGRL